MAAKVIRFIQAYIGQHQDDINSIAQQLGVPPMAIASAISEEMSHVYSEGAHRAVTKNLPDALGLRNARSISSHMRNGRCRRSCRWIDIVSLSAETTMSMSMLRQTPHPMRRR